MHKIILLLLITSSILSFSAEEKTVRVYVDMVADLFHAGHVELFKKARAHGNYLIVGLDDDDYAAYYKRRPIMTFDERRRVVESCKYVDEVIRAKDYSISEEWVLSNDIDIVIHGDDYSEEMLQHRYGEVIKVGKFRIVPYTKGISTSDIIQRVKNRD